MLSRLSQLKPLNRWLQGSFAALEYINSAVGMKKLCATHVSYTEQRNFTKRDHLPEAPSSHVQIKALCRCQTGFLLQAQSLQDFTLQRTEAAL